LTAYHYRRDPIDPAEPRFAGSLAAVAAFALVAALGRRRPAVPAAALSYAVLLAPNLGLVSYDLMLVADRYAYLATMPLFVLLAGGLARWATACRRPGPVVLAVVVAGLGLVGVLTASSWTQCRTWRDSETLVAHGLRVGSGRDALLESNFGVELFVRGRVARAMVHLRNAVRRDPADADARENLGDALARRGDLDGAIVQFVEAVRLAPDRFDLRHNLGLALTARGRLDDAAEQLAAAVRSRPDSARIHVSLGGVLAALGRRDEAAAQYAEALRLAPGLPDAVRGLGQLRRPGRSRPITPR
jgi:Flp pilus assembly protein TadD